MLRRFRRGQSILEYSVLLIVVIAALITMQIYVKRGFQGRWKSAVDDVGEQFDAEHASGTTTYVTQTNSHTDITEVEGTFGAESGFYTMRSDFSSSFETAGGKLTINMAK